MTVVKIYYLFFFYNVQLLALFHPFNIYNIQECNLEEVEEEEPPAKSSKDKKANGPDSGKGLVFKITSKVPYKTVLKGVFDFLIA